MPEKLDRETKRKIVTAMNQADLDVDMNELKINRLAVLNIRLMIEKVVMEAELKYKTCYPELVLALTASINDVVRRAKYHFMKDGKF